MKKKDYEKPTMRVVKIQHQHHLLSGSPYDDIKSPVATYDEPEDVITDKGGIW
ncbi:MAG: hypothetical protein IJ533_04890 [Prevotella sp.]|nr:hypothetical protein [Prevotella sp.]